MYEEPYRWVEAVGNRRQYLDEQFTKGAPVVALAYADGIVMLTVSRGTPKLYEIYDRIALGGMGHPADLEKLRFSLLEMAHVEGFNRSPSDVTGARLMKYGLAPTIKQAFEEIYKAPFIAKILLAELGTKAERDLFLTINYRWKLRGNPALGRTGSDTGRSDKDGSLPGISTGTCTGFVSTGCRCCSLCVGGGLVSPNFRGGHRRGAIRCACSGGKSDEAAVIPDRAALYETCATDRRREVFRMHCVGAQWAGVIEISLPPSRRTWRSSSFGDEASQRNLICSIVFLGLKQNMACW